MDKQYSQSKENSYTRAEIMQDRQNAKKTKIALIIAVSVLAITTLVFSILYFTTTKTSSELKVSLENIYEKNMNELIDNVNNSEVKLSKVLASDYKSYAKKTLNEISKNTTEAANNLSGLPLSIGGLEDTISFFNQVSGYAQSLAQKLDKGEALTQEDKQTIEQLHFAFIELRNNINKIAQDMYNGNILNSSLNIDGDYNDFTITMSGIKSADIEYPTMIYDGPFSDSQINRQIKNISSIMSSEQTAREKIMKLFTNLSEDSIDYLGDTNGQFGTYDYKISLQNGDDLYVQMIKNGAELLTISGNNGSSAKNISIDDAIEKAKDFVKRAGIEQMECVWSDVVDNDAYINLAPIQNNIILYPDLIKVKIDLATGNVLGYESSSFYTNHTDRELQTPQISDEQAKKSVPTGYKILSCKNALAPLEYGREVLCKELKCVKDGDIYYMYFNAQNGECENVLRVVSTDNGNLLI